MLEKTFNYQIISSGNNCHRPTKHLLWGIPKESHESADGSLRMCKPFSSDGNMKSLIPCEELGLYPLHNREIMLGPTCQNFGLYIVNAFPN